MKNIWSVICKNSIIDQDTNSLSLLESLDEIIISYKDPIDVNILKVAQIPFHIVSFWFDENIKKDRAFTLLIEIIDPSGKKLKDFKQDCVLPANRKRLRVVTKINGFGFTSEGIYKISVKYKENKGQYKTVSVMPVEVNFKKIEE